MKSYYIILSILFSTFCYPQIDTTKKDFYPLKIGNLWQYRNESNNLGNQKVVGDTAIDGINYFLLIHSLPSTHGVLRIDSLFRVINRGGGPFWGDTCGGNTPYESSVYHLNEADSTVWEICDGFTGIIGEQLVRFNRIRMMNIFGQPREVMEYDYGGAFLGDTIWFYGARLAKGIGIIEERYYEGSYWILQGCIIEGIQYGTIVSIDNQPELIPTQIVLHQNYPNPFNPSTKISYSIKEEGLVTLKVYDVLGKEVATLVNENKPEGNYEVEFNASALPSGMYIYKLQVGNFTDVKKMLLTK
jgi:hypothetical protein